jgi:hypothetical protein
MLTRKHFRAMAETIKGIRDANERKNAAEALAIMCQQSNGRFNREKFFTACGC